jgi:hypothetical protein
MSSSVRLFLAALCALAAPAVAKDASDTGFTPALFNRFIDMRVGDGAPVYWYSVGTVRAYPSGELLYRMEGFDTARMHWPDRSKPVVHQYNRKIYVFRDVATNQVVRTLNGTAVEPIAYPYQFISYQLIGSQVKTIVEQGQAPRVQRIESDGTKMAVKPVGNALMFTAPVYLDFPTPNGGRYQAFENYDFMVQPRNSGVNVPNQLSWLRTGPLPASLGGGQSVMHLVSWRVDRYADLPKTIRDYVETDAPLWKLPPRDLTEIRKLQAPATPPQP